MKQLIAGPIQIRLRKFTKAYRQEKVMIPAEYSEVQTLEDSLTVVTVCRLHQLDEPWALRICRLM